MASPQKRQAAPFEVENPAAAFHKLENFTRKVLAVPKNRVDGKIKPKPRQERRQQS